MAKKQKSKKQELPKESPELIHPKIEVEETKEGEVKQSVEIPDEEDNQTFTPANTAIVDPDVDELPLKAKLGDGEKTKKSEQYDYTRYGAGKEKPAHEIENAGESRHYDRIGGYIEGRKNEYPR